MKPTRRTALGALLALPLAARAEAAPQTFGVMDAGQLGEVLAGRLEPFSGYTMYGAGVVAGVWQGGTTRFITQKLPNAPAMNADSVFEIGGVTGLFTGTILADMVRRGEVALTDPIDRYLPSGVKAPTFAGQQIKLIDLATHTSGLPLLFAYRYRDNTDQQLYKLLAKYKLSYPIGSRFKYSEAGSGLLALGLARRARKPYGQLLRERVLVPLGMNQTGVVMTAAMRKKFVPGIDQYGALADVTDFGVLVGAAGIRSTARDMLKFLAANLILKPDAIGQDCEATQKPERPTTNGGFIGLFWNTEPNGRVTWATGQTNGFYAFAGLSSDRSIGTVILANVPRIGLDEVGLHVLDKTLLPFTPFPKVVKVDDAALNRYVGDYTVSGQTIAIRRAPAGLTAQLEDYPQALPLYPSSPTDFFFRAIDEQISFVVESGKVTKLTVHRSGMTYDADRIR